MKVGVMSDSHGNVKFVQSLAEWFTKSKFQKIIHLGDDFEDAAKWPEIVRVPGVLSDTYKNPDIPNRLVIEFEGWQVLLTHTRKSHKNDLPTDLKPAQVIKDKEASVVLYGHTHIPTVQKEKGAIYVNPGHLRASDKKGQAPTFGILDFQKGMLGIKIIDFKTRIPVLAKFFIQ